MSLVPNEVRFSAFLVQAGDWRGIGTIAIVDKTPTSVAVSGVVSSRNLLERGKNAGVCEGCLQFSPAREWDALVLFNSSPGVPMCGLTGRDSLHLEHLKAFGALVQLLLGRSGDGVSTYSELVVL